MKPRIHHHAVTDNPGATPNGGADDWTGSAMLTPETWPGADTSVGLFGADSLGSGPFLATQPTGGPPSGTSTGFGGQSGGLVINVSYDAVLTALQTSDPTKFAAYTAAINAAVGYFESEFTNPITLNITFGYGEANGNSITGTTAGRSNYFFNTYSYSTFYNDIKNGLQVPGESSVQAAALASLPASDPTTNGQFRINLAEQKALGLLGNTSAPDGYVGISSSLAFDFTQPNGSGTYDAIAVLEHEISEVMGRADALGKTDQNIPADQDYTLLDFFRYAAPGVLSEPFVSGYNASAQTYFSPDGSTLTLPYDTNSQILSGLDVADWTNSVNNDAFGFAIQGQTGQVSTPDLQELNILGYDEAPCFLPGTRIATPSGEVAVEALAVGDMILTLHGEAQPITWIGHGKALATRGRRTAATPVIVQKGALGDNVPNRKLRITKGHSLYIDGVLIPAEFLVNHRSIVWDDRAREVEIYHIELAVHAVLIANGTPAETYRDDGNRWLFQNANTGWDQPAKPPCAPVLTGGPVVDAIWQRILARSGPRPGLPMTNDPDVHLLADGRRVDGRKQPNGSYLFHLTTPPTDVRIASRAGAQDELGLARDPRVLGVAVRQVVLWRGRYPTLIAADDTRLCDGFHQYETDNGFRWTNGDAVLPAALFDAGGSPIDLELFVGGTTHYPLLEDQTCVAA